MSEASDKYGIGQAIGVICSAIGGVLFLLLMAWAFAGTENAIAMIRALRGEP